MHPIVPKCAKIRGGEPGTDHGEYRAGGYDLEVAAYPRYKGGPGDDDALCGGTACGRTHTDQVLGDTLSHDRVEGVVYQERGRLLNI